MPRPLIIAAFWFEIRVFSEFILPGGSHVHLTPVQRNGKAVVQAESLTSKSSLNQAFIDK
jgi:hypothetical protein